MIQSLGDQLRNLIDIVRTENQIHEAVAFLQLRHDVILLHHAAAQADHHVRIFLLIGVKLSKSAVYSGVCIFTHGTGIVENKVGILCFNLSVPDFFQDTAKLFGIPRIHLASEGDHIEGERSSCSLGNLRQLPARSLNKIILPEGFVFRRGFSGIYTADDLFVTLIIQNSVFLS